MSSQIVAQEFPFATSPQNLRKEIDEILNCDVVNRHSFFQLKYFVVGKEYTTQSRLWCCIRELQARRASIEGLERQIEELKDDKELALLQICRLQEKPLPGTFGIDSPPSEIDTKEREIHIRKMNRKIEAFDKAIADHQRKLKDTEEEAAFLAMAYRKIEEKERLLPYDDLKSQTEYWNEKLTQELNLRLLTNHPLDLELIKTILSLNDEAPIKNQTLHILKQLEMRPVLEAQARKKLAGQKSVPETEVPQKIQLFKENNE
jgi:hypothetical protein